MENFKIFWNESYFLRHNFTKQRVRGSKLSRWKETKAHRDKKTCLTHQIEKTSMEMTEHNKYFILIHLAMSF